MCHNLLEYLSEAGTYINRESHVQTYDRASWSHLLSESINARYLYRGHEECVELNRAVKDAFAKHHPVIRTVLNVFILVIQRNEEVYQIYDRTYGDKHKWLYEAHMLLDKAVSE